MSAHTVTARKAGTGLDFGPSLAVPGTHGTGSGRRGRSPWWSYRP